MKIRKLVLPRFIGWIVALVIVSTIITIPYRSSQSNAVVTPSSGDIITRGAYLVNTIGCNDCHSPKKIGDFGPEPDLDLLLSGYPSNKAQQPINGEVLKSWVLFDFDLTTTIGPWGQSFAANITSDPTGIGNWTEEQFFRALREGKYKGLERGRALLPPMPWPVYKNLSDEDISAIFAYLKSTKPVRNIVPSPRSFDQLNFN